MPHGLAAVKALILGKFILLEEMFGVGERWQFASLLRAIAGKTMQFFLLLLVLSAIEEIVVGWLHGRTLAQTVGELAAQSWRVTLAQCLVLLLILIPLIVGKELTRVLGLERIVALLTR